MRFLPDYTSNTLGEKIFGKKSEKIRKFLNFLEEKGLYITIRRNYSFGENPEELFLSVLLMKKGEYYEYRD